MGLKVEQLQAKHPVDFKEGIIVELAHYGETFTEDCLGRKYITCGADTDWGLVDLVTGAFHSISIEDDELIQVRPLPNGTRLVVTSNEGGQG